MAYAVLTRDHAGAGRYAAALQALGLDVIAMPVTWTAPPEDPDALVRALEAGGYIAIVCASARAAGALIRAKGHAAIPEVWAVGQATAETLRLAHVVPIVPEGVRDGTTLARALVAARAIAGKRVLVPRAEDGRDEAIAILRDAGALVDDVIAYRTVPAPADHPDLARGRMLLESGSADVCAVFAPSQVTALDALVGLRRIETRFAAIGETTAGALREAGVEPACVAESPTPEGLAKAIAAVYPRAP